MTIEIAPTRLAVHAKHDVAIDISGRYHPNLWQLIGWCAEAGTKVTLGSDAHHVREVALITRKLMGTETDA